MNIKIIEAESIELAKDVFRILHSLPYKLWKSFFISFVFCIVISYFQIKYNFNFEIKLNDFYFFSKIENFKLEISSIFIVNTLISFSSLTFIVGIFNIVIHNKNTDAFINFYYYIKYTKYIAITILIELLYIFYDQCSKFNTNYNPLNYIGIDSGDQKYSYLISFIVIIINSLIIHAGLFLFILKIAILDDRFNTNFYKLTSDIFSLFYQNFIKIIYISINSLGEKKFYLNF